MEKLKNQTQVILTYEWKVSQVSQSPMTIRKIITPVDNRKHMLIVYYFYHLHTPITITI